MELRVEKNTVGQGRLLRIPLWQLLPRGSAGGGILCVLVGHLVPLGSSMSRDPADGDLVSCGRKARLDLDGGDAEALPRTSGVVPNPRDGPRRWCTCNRSVPTREAPARWRTPLPQRPLYLCLVGNDVPSTPPPGTSRRTLLPPHRFPDFKICLPPMSAGTQVLGASGGRPNGRAAGREDGEMGYGGTGGLPNGRTAGREDGGMGGQAGDRTGGRLDGNAGKRAGDRTGGRPDGNAGG